MKTKKIFSLLQGQCLLSDTELALGEDIIIFPSPSEMGYFMLDLAFDLGVPEEELDLSEDPLFYGLTMRKRKPSDPKGRTIKQSITEAIEYVVKTDWFYGDIIKRVSYSEPPFTAIAYGMQDALYYALLDCENGTKDDIFSAYLYNHGCGVWMNLMSFEDALELLKYFFDRYYPKVKDRTCKVNRG